MKNMATQDQNTVTRQKCFICEKEIAERWFCRIPRDGKPVVFCSPSCTLRYFDSLSRLNPQNGGQ